MDNEEDCAGHEFRLRRGKRLRRVGKFGGGEGTVPCALCGESCMLVMLNTGRFITRPYLGAPAKASRRN